MVERIYLVLEVFTVVYCLFALYGEKFRLDICTVVLVAIDIIFMEAVNEGIISENLTGLIYPVIFVYSLVEFKRNLKVTIANNFLYIIIVGIVQLISSIPFLFIENLEDSYGMVILVINIMTLVVIVVLDKIIKFKRLSEYTISIDWLSVVLILLYLVLILYSIQKYRNQNRMMTEYYLLLMGFIVLTVAFTVKWQSSRNRIMRQKLELEMYEFYNHTFEGLVHSIRRKQHDYKNQLNAIYSQHYTSKTYEELVAKQKDYLEYINHENELDHLLAINIPIIGGFLYSRFSGWRSENINIIYKIDSSAKSLEVPIYEVITILGILLDNARDAIECCSEEERKIGFVMDEHEENIVFQVKNPSEYLNSDKISQIFKEGYSSKGAGRGIGLYNARKKSVKYGMSLMVANEEIEGQNWICFALNVKKEKECAD